MMPWAGGPLSHISRSGCTYKTLVEEWTTAENDYCVYLEDDLIKPKHAVSPR